MGNENGLAHLAGIGVLSSLILAKTHNGARYYVLTFVSLSALIFTGSRGGYLVTGIGIFMLSIAYIEENHISINLSRISIHGFFLSTYLYFILILIYSPNILNNLPIHLAGRVDLWNATHYIVSSNILTGTGYTAKSITGVAQTNGILIVQETLPAHLHGLSPHNSYLRVFLHTGAIGGFLYILLLHICLYRISTITDSTIRYAGICLGIVYVVMQHVESFSIIGFNIHSLIFALIIGYGIQSKKEIQSTAVRTNRQSK
ncbi:O-antigen ligase [Halorubrum sp. ARQ200]|uniref:O-antigen ligase family protein n=1 Tax=Halorubrum sp. ARQ200 TaxID=1855872 RepID=UPI0013052BB2|nr:O-antigen ligase family protein [Halorubrum sp. ARQ200]